MDRRAFLRAALGASAALALDACTRSGSGAPPSQALGPAPRPTLRVPGGSFGFPSPFAYNGGPGYWRVSYLYDTLLWKDSTGALLPWLAGRYERSEDGLAYTFELRDDVRWHDGRPLTVDDVVFSFEYLESHPVSPLQVAQPHDIAEVRPAGGSKVQVRLDKPFVTFAEQIAGAVPVFPRHVWSGVTDPTGTQDLKMLVGSGPYRLESFSDEQGSYLYVANDAYFLGRPFVKRVEMRPVSDALTSLRAGDVDAGGPDVQGVTPDALAPFRSDPFGVIDNPAGFAFPLYWNTSKGGALADVRFRQACAKAIDRQDIVRRLLKGNGAPGNPGFLPPGHPFHAQVEQHGFDPAAANRLLDDAGYRPSGPGGVRQGPDGRPLRFRLVVAALGSPALVELVRSGLRAVGVEVNPEFKDLVRLFAAKLTGDYDMAITLYPGPSGPGPMGDPDYLRTIYSSRVGTGFHAVQGYANQELDDLADRQLVTFDQDRRKDLVARIQRIVARDVPVLPLYYSTLFFAYRSSVFDQWYYTPGGGFGPGVPEPYNKHAFVTGQKTGTTVRAARD